MSNQLIRTLAVFTLLIGACSGDGEMVEADRDDDDYPYPAGKVFFSAPPIDLDGVVFFEPMGALFTPFQEDHGGFHHTETGVETPTIPVIAPADGQIIEIRPHAGCTAEQEHAVRLKVSTTITILWGHVGRLADHIAEAAGPLGNGTDVRIPVEAGEEIGFVSECSALDVGISDTSVDIGLLHPEIETTNNHAVALEDYYREPLRTQVVNTAFRSAPPRTGEMGHDVAGTISGLWYLQGSEPSDFEEWQRAAIHFGYHHVIADRATFFHGADWLDQHSVAGGVSAWRGWIRGNPRPEDITPASGPVKLELVATHSGWTGNWPDVTLASPEFIEQWVQDRWTTSILLVEMISDTELRFERFDAQDTNGISPEEVEGFTSDAKVYVRNPLP